MPEQHLDVHELGSGLQEPGRVGVPELVGGDRLIDACPSEEPPQVGPHHVGHRRLTAGRLGKHEILLGLVREPKPKYLAEDIGQRHQATDLAAPSTTGVIIPPRYFLKRPFSVVVVWYEAIAKMAPTIHWLE
jgi:hypothetical protein